MEKLAMDTRTPYDALYDRLFAIIQNYRRLPDGDEGKIIVDNAMKSYERLCERLGDDASMRRYSIFEQKYLLPKKHSDRIIANKHFIHLRTLYRDVEYVMRELMVIVHGVDGIRWR